MAGARNEAAFAREGEEARVEAVPSCSATAVARLSNQISRLGAGEELEGVELTAGESLEVLAMSEHQIHFAAVGFNQAEGVELARGAL